MFSSFPCMSITVYFTTVPGGPPVLFTPTVIEPSLVMFTWSPPVKPNGVITSYTITYNLTGELTSVVVSNATEFSISGLKAYTFYQFTIFASTIIGDGPATLPIVLQTAIHGSYSV